MLTLKRITDIEIIKKVLFSDCIWDRISEDEQTRESFEFENNKNYLWIGVYLDKKIIGMFFLHPTNNTTIQIHIHILEKFREKYAYESGAKIISWFIHEAPKNIVKMIAEIPALYQDVYHYSKKFNFVDEGLNRASFKKNRIMHDQYRIGITKKEAKIWEQQQQ